MQATDFICSQITKWAKKHEQNRQKRTSPFLCFAKENCPQESEDEAETPVQFGRTKVLNLSSSNYFILVLGYLLFLAASERSI